MKTKTIKLIKSLYARFDFVEFCIKGAMLTGFIGFLDAISRF